MVIATKSSSTLPNLLREALIVGILRTLFFKLNEHALLGIFLPSDASEDVYSMTSGMAMTLCNTLNILRVHVYGVPKLRWYEPAITNILAACVPLVTFTDTHPCYSLLINGFVCVAFQSDGLSAVLYQLSMFLVSYVTWLKEMRLGNALLLECGLTAKSCPMLCTHKMRMETAFFSIMFPGIVIELAGVRRRDFSIYEQLIYVCWFPVIMGLPVEWHPQVDVFAYSPDGTFPPYVALGVYVLLCIWAMQTLHSYAIYLHFYLKSNQSNHNRTIVDTNDAYMWLGTSDIWHVGPHVLFIAKGKQFYLCRFLSTLPLVMFVCWPVTTDATQSWSIVWVWIYICVSSFRLPQTKNRSIFLLYLCFLWIWKLSPRPWPAVLARATASMKTYYMSDMIPRRLIIS